MVCCTGTEQYLQGGAKLPTGGKVREREMRRFGETPKPTVQSGWKKIRKDYLLVLRPEFMLRAYFVFLR